MTPSAIRSVAYRCHSYIQAMEGVSSRQEVSESIRLG